MVLLRMGPRGLGPNLFSTVSKLFCGFRDFGCPEKVKVCIAKKISVRLQMFAILANVDLSLKLKIRKLAI